MSPNAYVAFNDAGLLCGYQGEEEHEKPVFKWTYSTFERHLNECVTPSMYHLMAGYVHNNLTKDDLWNIQSDDYCDGHLEADAVDAYFELPIKVRISMHEQELVNMRVARRAAEAKESAAIDAMLEENKPFDDTSPISHEYAEFMRSLIAKARREIEKWDVDIHEEEQWRAEPEDDNCNSIYDPMDEY